MITATQKQILFERAQALRFPGVVVGNLFFRGEEQWQRLTDESRALMPADFAQIEQQLTRESELEASRTRTPEPPIDEEAAAIFDRMTQERIDREILEERAAEAIANLPATRGQLDRLIALQERMVEALEKQGRQA